MTRPQAYILAGGRSLRFGSDKAVATVDGRALWATVAAALEGAGQTPVLIGRRLRGLPIPELIEGDGPHHPLRGIATALAHAASLGQLRALIAPCDLRQLQAGQVRRVLHRAQEQGTSCFARGQPLLAVLDTNHAALALTWAETNRSLREFHQHLGSIEVDVGDLENLNRPPP
jgi:molybdopterin-guanine dinucleotide biosynthesis protein A